jgi:phosphatidylserine/phosphatidylglycerophosphate/cardiolipin synthase-like enzyme
VLTKNRNPEAVLLGSTNLTENGIFGHANCAHVAENHEIAAKYLSYFDKLTEDPETSSRVSDYKEWKAEETPTPANEYFADVAAVFSPRSNLEALE